MASCVLTSANILMGGNSRFRSRWVSGRCVCWDRQKFSGSARRIGALDGAGVVVHPAYGGGSRSLGIGAARFFESTDFCGFQRAGRRTVARPASHGGLGMPNYCGLQGACPLTVSYPPSARVAAGQGGAPSTARPDRAGGCPPFAASRCRYARRGCGGTRFQKSSETPPITLPSHDDRSERREVQFNQMGSGVRAASSRQKLAEKPRFRGARVGFPKGVGGKVAGHVPLDVAVAAMLCGAVNRVN